MSSFETVTSALTRLVGFDTTSRLSNLELIEWLEETLRPHADHMQRIPNSTGDKSNLWVRIGPDVPGGVVLSGHTDVVPVDGQDWRTDPFTVTPADDRFYGRGTSDMKSFIAMCVAFAPDFAAADLKRPIHFAFSYDEEVGCLGSPDMVATIAAASAPPSVGWVGEPTLWSVMSGHKSISTYEVEVTGHEVHSSLPHLGVSAVHEALDLMNMLRVIAMQAESDPPEDSPFDPPHATLTIGQVQGGTAANILAGHCRFVFDLRSPPQIDVDDLLSPFFELAGQMDQRIKAQFPECGVEVRQRSGTPGLNPDRDSEAESFVRAITGDNASHFASYAAEAGQFQQAGIATVICGPGNIEQAHQPNEWIARDQIQRGVDVFKQLLSQMI